ncbi:hypothetical protein ACFVU2_18910 [Leifsonia sp. NPDC058194]|uniref:hypothetical protein n=1 Tax=Leifsonia sp. NPDC058194 TaxID=3346374 RepID=UPI0036DD3DF1
MSENTITLDANASEGDRIIQVIHSAADLAFQGRVRKAISDLKAHLGDYADQKLTERRKHSGIDARRWIALRLSTRNAHSVAEFRLLARVLGVSPRWLATGQQDDSTRSIPPAGWSVIGTHLDTTGPLEFSTELDDAGMPLWERPLQEVLA